MANEKCPGGISDVKITDWSIGGRTYHLCAKYEDVTRITGFLPSFDFCPDCRYNGVTVRKQANEDLSNKFKRA